MKGQLPLPVGLRDGNTLDAFLPSANPEAFAAVRRLVEGTEGCVYLWGPPDSGRTHLLEAATDGVARQQLPACYLAADALAAAGAGVLDGLALPGALVCIDDIDRFAGDRGWEEQFFHLFNAVRARQARLLVAAGGPPGAVGFSLPDLSSRLASGLVVGLAPLDDEARLAVLAFRAARRGLELPSDTARYLLARSSRKLADLVALLGRLEHQASVSKRRLTVPFVREVLGS